jgi:hypothetical protein
LHAFSSIIKIDQEKEDAMGRARSMNGEERHYIGYGEKVRGKTCRWTILKWILKI